MKYIILIIMLAGCNDNLGRKKIYTNSFEICVGGISYYVIGRGMSPNTDKMTS